MAKSLSAKEVEFVRLILDGSTRCDAYTAVWPPKGSNSRNPKTLHKAASVKAQQHHVAKAIQDANDKVLAKATEKLSVESTLGILAGMARTNPTDLIGKTGKIKDDINLDDLTPDQKAAIANIDKDGHVTFCDRLKSTDMYMKHHGQYSADTSQEKPVNVNITIAKDGE